MNMKSKWARTIFGFSALGATILLSAPVKANCNTADSVSTTTYGTWKIGDDFCNTEIGNGSAAVAYAVAFANNSNFGNTGYAVTWTYDYENYGGFHQYQDQTCVLCANVGWQCDPTYTPWQNTSGGAGQYPPSSAAGCPYGDGATAATGFVILQ
jgi:hypothetical protein